MWRYFSAFWRVLNLVIPPKETKVALVAWLLVSFVVLCSGFSRSQANAAGLRFPLGKGLARRSCLAFPAGKPARLWLFPSPSKFVMLNLFQHPWSALGIGLGHGP